nr:zinc ribbon domain-containing protein [Candidatus Sigynarchaeota archaeon]
RIAKVLIFLSPLVGFFVPAPVPIIFLLQTNQINWLWGFFYTGIFLMISGILLVSAKAAVLKSIKETEPSPPTLTHANDALEADKRLLQTTTHKKDARSPVPNVQIQLEAPGTQMQGSPTSTTTQDMTAIKEKQTSYPTTMFNDSIFSKKISQKTEERNLSSDIPTSIDETENLMNPPNPFNFIFKLERRKCPNCGKEGPLSSVCPYCGYNLIP